LLRMANLSIEHGNTDGSCYAYVCLNTVVGSRFGDYRAGFRFGQLSLDLVEKRGLDRFKARVYNCFGGMVIPWMKHLRTARPLVRRALAVAQEAGDLTFAVFSFYSVVTNLLVSGDPLGDVQREAENGLESGRKARFGFAVLLLTGPFRLVRTLRGLTEQSAAGGPRLLVLDPQTASALPRRGLRGGTGRGRESAAAFLDYCLVHRGS